MSARSEVARSLAELGATQWGLLTAAQARRVGLTVQQLARLANEGALEHVVCRAGPAPGVEGRGRSHRADGGPDSGVGPVQTVTVGSR